MTIVLTRQQNQLLLQQEESVDDPDKTKDVESENEF